MAGVGFFAAGLLLTYSVPLDAAPLPGTPDTGAPEAADRHHPAPQDQQTPAFVAIPSVGIDASIVPVGVNEKGEMAVPDGSTDAIGWYQGGPRPGEMGSAVLAAHVYAGFKKLRGIEPGAEIEVVSHAGEALRYVVEEVKLTPLAEVSPYFLFERADAARLNLITCAGKFDKKLGTYTHRLVVYATLKP
jgi:sortase (surface protein transpeptidase)